MNEIGLNRYNIDNNLFKHLDIDFDLTYDSDGTLNKSLIYFLSIISADNEKILYVGQTNVTPEIRIKNHMENLEFTHIYIKQLETNDRETVNSYEQKYIKKFNPALQYILTPFENENHNGQVPYDYIVKWSSDRKKPRRPGRPRVKEECKSISVKIPIRILDELDGLFSKDKSIQLNKTQLITNLLEEYITKNNC